ncbi:MAG: hypothetical protein J7J54_05765 [Candidatus Omnitrophica bacterium]|nr:hypothetical protein [Candidatus Omnitrophota bacterium]
MKEVTCKKLTSDDRRRKIVSFRERHIEKGRRIEVFKNYIYNITEEKEFEDSSKIELFLHEIQKIEEPNQVYIKKIVDTNTGKVVISYIIKGKIFALVRNKLYRIAFKQEHILESTPV